MELTLVDVNIDIQEGDMGLGGVSREVGGQRRNMSLINLSQRVGL